MEAVNRNLISGLMMGAFILFPVYPALASGDDAKKHGEETLVHAEAMVDHGGQGHMDVMTEHAKELMMHAEETIKALPAGDMHGNEVKEHFQEAITAAEKAIDHGGQGHGGTAMKHAKSALMHAQEGAKHLSAVE